jgi:hypothetical protein
MADLREMTPEVREAFLERLDYFLKGDPYAQKFCLDLLYIAHLWDDLIDQDKPRTGEDISLAFTKALMDLPSNPFYQAHFQMLWALVTNALLQWKDANALMEGNRDHRLMSFILRNALFSVIYFSMYLIGKEEWVAEHGVEFWSFFCQGLAGKFEQDIKEADHA